MMLTCMKMSSKRETSLAIHQLPLWAWRGRTYERKVAEPMQSSPRRENITCLRRELS